MAERLALIANIEVVENNPEGALGCLPDCFYYEITRRNQTELLKRCVIKDGFFALETAICRLFFS